MFEHEFDSITYTFSPSIREYRTMPTEELREAFLVPDLFQKGKIILKATDLDRAIIGGIIPTSEPLALKAVEALRCDYFFERREGGVINLGGSGVITVDEVEYPIEKGECLYIGRGSREVTFHSAKENDLAVFYLLSYPAHREFPTAFAKREDARVLHLGSSETSNERTLFQYIHEDGIQSCQLVMGFTELKPGSVWNTMPTHTHLRRSEIYLYFDVPETDQVHHFMGQPDATRGLWMKNREAVLSPSWSIHSGVGTAAYSFVWGMGGENQIFDDMDAVKIPDLK